MLMRRLSIRARSCVRVLWPLSPRARAPGRIARVVRFRVAHALCSSLPCAVRYLARARRPTVFLAAYSVTHLRTLTFASPAHCSFPTAANTTALPAQGPLLLGPLDRHLATSPPRHLVQLNTFEATSDLLDKRSTTWR